MKMQCENEKDQKQLKICHVKRMAFWIMWKMLAFPKCDLQQIKNIISYGSEETIKMIKLLILDDI